MSADHSPAARGAHKGAEVDAVTGQEMTGHEWDGIRELNRPLPRWWLWTFYATIVWAAVYVVLYPALPLLKGATTGLLGYSNRAAVEADIETARQGQVALLDQIATLPLDEVRADDALMRFAVSGGRSAFLVNCIQCHGTGAAGSPGYANLNDDDWLWGGTLDDIYRTIAFGIRSDHPDTRISLMPSFGADGILTREQVDDVADFVLSLSGATADPARAERGKAVFAANCAACHGQTGAGNREFGAPPLNDVISLYSGDRAAIVQQIRQPRHGVMPAWSGRLPDAVIRELALYVFSLGGGQAGE
jgi:cytochrome c oxidase cbb3-type subunit 3